MATVSAKVYEHHKKNDGTYNVKICVHHKSERKFIDTNHYVVKKQLTKDYRIKDPFIADKVEQQLRDYRKEISELGDKLDFFTAETLRDYLRDKDEDIDFVKFCDKHIEGLRKDGREEPPTTTGWYVIAWWIFSGARLFPSMKSIPICS